MVSLLYLALFLLGKKQETVALRLELLPEFLTYYDSVRLLGPDERPDYDHLQQLFRDALRREGISRDYSFAWAKAAACELEPGPFQGQLVVKFYKRLVEAEHTARPSFHWHHDYLINIHSLLRVLQHAPASQALHRLQIKIQNRVWSLGIHSFLEALRADLPASRDCMLSFTYLAYSTIILLLEESSSFGDTWHKYLGHISRYRWHIDTNTRDAEHWGNIAHDWYLKAYGRYPTAGFPNFNLGLTSSNFLQQLFYYSKALYAEVPCAHSLQPSFNVFFDATLMSPLNMPLVKAHASLFTGKEKDFGLFSKEFLDQLRNTRIGKVASRIAIINITAILGYGNTIPENEEKVVLGN
jgi:hypothetical protein